MELRDALERATPLRTEIAPDWADVVRRARQRRHAVPALAAATAAAASAVAALWPSGGSGVLQRALAAIGDGPVVHVVYRSEAHETVVDLTTGKRRPLAMVDEQWYEAGKGMKTVSHFDGRIVGEGVSGPDHVSRFEAETAAGALDGYRTALAAGDAHVIGSDTIAARDVYWIAFRPDELPDVADGKLHSFGLQVAVDRATYRPVYLRYARDGVPNPETGEEILSIDTLPAGAVDFTATSGPQQTRVFGRTDVSDITANLASAATALGHAPLWLGATYDGHPLVQAQLETLVNVPARAKAVALCYGSPCGPLQPPILVEESASADAFLDAPSIPPGSAVIDWSGRAVFIQRDGLTIHVTAGSEAEALAAARALQEANVSR